LGEPKKINSYLLIISMYDAHRRLIGVGNTSLRQYYTPEVLNVYKQKNP